MQNTSDLYKSIRDNPLCSAETRATIAGVLYEQDRLSPPETTGSLFPDGKPSVGNCISRQLDLTILPAGTIPRMAEIKLETRLVIKDALTEEILQASEWIPKGTFYIDTRAQDEVEGTLKLHAYDAILKMEQTYLPDGGVLEEWPKPMPEVAADIAAKLGLTIDARTVLNERYMVGLPVEYTMREVMGYIAAAHCGNWIITDAGDLRLITLACIPAESSYLVSEDGHAITFGGVRIIV